MSTPISFATEENRVAWTQTPTHQQVWPTIEGTLKGQKGSVCESRQVLLDLVKPLGVI